MKVLLTILNRESAIKVDFPIIPDYNSIIYLSPEDYKKLETTLMDMKIPNKELHTKITKKEKDMVASIMLENSTVQAIDIAWDEEEKAYLPLVCLSISDDFFGDDIDDIDEDDIQECNEEEPKHRKPSHGKKKDLFS